jgi:FMN reductase
VSTVASGVLGSVGSKRTKLLVDLVLDAAVTAGATRGQTIDLGSIEIIRADGTPADDMTGDTRHAIDVLEESDLIVIGTPIYRATYSGLLKSFLDLVPRGGYDGSTAPLRAKPVVVVATAATPQHFLGIDQLKLVLHGFFAAHVLPPGVFASAADFTEQGVSPALAEAADTAGRAMVDLGRAIAGSAALAALQPQI